MGDWEIGRLGQIRTFEDLDVWQMGRDLTLKIYEITSHFPKEEVYGMTSQIKKGGKGAPIKRHPFDNGGRYEIGRFADEIRRLADLEIGNLKRS